MLFDEIGFENECFFFRAGDDGLYVIYFIHQDAGFYVPVSCIFIIGGQPFLQISGLADIDHHTGGIFHQIDTGLVGDSAQLLSDINFWIHG